ncbi:HNH endonuclease (plasmid) [Cupriavidus necator]|nr:HNH endonuclease [Cupriavidus necator]
MATPDELTAARIIAAAQAWGDQTDAFRTAHAARDWEVWIAGAAYPVKAICRLAYLALGYDPQSIQAWKKGDRYSPWDKQIEALGFEIHAKADPEEFELERFLEREDMPTEIRREGIVRLTQGRFRRDLIAARRGAERCDVTGIAIPEILRASHIHRWTDCKDTPMMRKDPANGLLLAAHLDALFEHGLIAFANDGRMLVSGRLDTVERKRLHIDEPWQLRFTPSPQQCKYLAIHRKRTRAARGEDQE